jgi:hypothetical protein
MVVVALPSSLLLAHSARASLQEGTLSDGNFQKSFNK